MLVAVFVEIYRAFVCVAKNWKKWALLGSMVTWWTTCSISQRALRNWRFLHRNTSPMRTRVCWAFQLTFWTLPRSTFSTWTCLVCPSLIFRCVYLSHLPTLPMFYFTILCAWMLWLDLEVCGIWWRGGTRLRELVVIIAHPFWFDEEENGLFLVRCKNLIQHPLIMHIQFVLIWIWSISCRRFDFSWIYRCTWYDVIFSWIYRCT